MSGREKISALTTAHSMCVALLMCVMLVGCQTVKPQGGMLDRIQQWAAPAPPHRLSPENEQQPAKLAMTEWLEKSLNNEYHVIYGEFVWAESGFTDGAAMGAKAGQYVEQTLGAVPQPDIWSEGKYQHLLWRQERGMNGSPTYIAFVIAGDPLPEMDGRRLVGFLELIPSDQLPPIIVCCH
jgi:hypothetical protein